MELLKAIDWWHIVSIGICLFAYHLWEARAERKKAKEKFQEKNGVASEGAD